MKSFAGIMLVASLQAICLIPSSGQQVSVLLSSTGTWSAQAWSRIEIQISGAAGSGPCRFVQPFPSGFVVRPVEAVGGELFLENDILNIVWAVFPSGRSTTVIYEVMPEKGLSGEFTLGGIFYSVGRSNYRTMTPVPGRRILIGAGTVKAEQPAITSPVTGSEIGESQIVFRVQVLSSATRMGNDELMKRLGVRLDDRITVIEAGNIYRYQVGECPTFDCALKINESLKRAGVEGSFIVAFRGSEQLTVEQARSLQR